MQGGAGSAIPKLSSRAIGFSSLLIAILLTIVLAPSSALATQDPIAAYSFDEGRGSIAGDFFGDHDGTISGAIWDSSGKYGAALDFDGTDDKVTIPDSAALDFTDAFTLEAWVRPEATGTLKPVISKVALSGTRASGYRLSVEGTYGKPNGTVAADGTGAWVTGTAALPVNDWSHIALTSDGTTLRLYIDGELDATAPSLTARTTTGTDLEIGASTILSQYFNGLIDEVRLYDEVLSVAEIERDLDAAIATQDPIAAYSFDEGRGSIAGDFFGDHDGTISGAIWDSSGKYGAALDFDGTDDKVTIPDSAALDFTDTFTLEAWVRPEATGTLKPVISKVALSGTRASGYRLSVEGTYGKPNGTVAADGTGAWVTGTAALPVNDWSHIALTSDGTTLRLYIDGELDATAPSLTARTTTGTDLEIGASTILSQYFNGLIDEVRLYDEVLSVAEIERDLDAAIATQDPIAAYSFDEGRGSIAGDFFGDHDGTISGAIWAGGKYGSALSFDGVDDIVRIADAAELDLTDSFTLEAWVRPGEIEALKPILAKSHASGSDTGYLLSVEGTAGRPMGHVADGGAVAGVIGTAALPVNDWSHLALTSDGANLRLYIDGELDAAASALIAGGTSADLEIGASTALGRYFDGLIDEVRLYDEVLSEAEIEDDLETAIETPPSRGPIAVYSFNEGTGTRVNDSAGNHDGTITGADWVEGKFGRALDFESGDRDIVEIPDSHDFDLSDAFTLQAWVRPETNGVWRFVIGKETSSFYSYSLYAGADTNVPAGYVADRALSYSKVNGASELPLENWSHLTLTSDSKDLRLYVGGTLVDTAVAKSAQSSDSPLRIGGNQVNKYFDGAIDEVRIYNRALSAAEIDPTQTTIISPRPSYTSGEQWPIEFTANEARSTFRCSLDDPNEAPTATCQSPYSLPSNLSPGWHTFVVAATDSKGITDPTPAKWTFNTAIYPEAPATSKLTSPEEGERTSHYFTLQAEWGEAPSGGGVTGVTFQVRAKQWRLFKTIPAQYVLDSNGEQVSWPLPVSNNPGKSSPLYFDARAFPDFKNEHIVEDDVKFRAVLDGGVNAAGVSKPVTTEFSLAWGPPSNATEAVGPVDLNLMTGYFTISRTDVSIPIPGSDAVLEFTRVFDSGYRSQRVDTRVLGSIWQPSVPVEMAYPGSAWQKIEVRHEDAIPPYVEDGEVLEEGIPAADWVEVVDNSGAGIAFDLVGGNYVAPEYAREYRLTKEGDSFVLVDPDGTRTIFIPGYESGQYVVSTVSWQSTSRSARMVYENASAYRRLKMMIAPSAKGVTCSDAPGPYYAPTTPGCRSLTFQYTDSEEHYRYDRLASITYHNATGFGSQVVAQYGYNADRSLSEVWDPRVSPALKERYTYSATTIVGEQLATLTPPGQEPFKFNYYSGYYTDRLKSVSRASLLASPTEAQTTIAYNVPVRGDGAPYDLSPGAVANWGQADYPVNATAIFPPDQIPSSDPPSDYSRASIHYMDPDGHLVNTASPPPPGVEGDVISTSETDEHGNVVRSLSPRARLLALADSDPAARSQELDTRSVYSSDGTKLIEEWGPLHEVRLESGSTVEARMHRTVQYDEGATTPPEGTPMPLLPTTETVGARIPGQGSDLDVRVTKTNYDWTLRKPTETIVDPSGLNLRTRVIYDETTGLPIERRLPANPNGGDARSTKILYYTAEKVHPIDDSCANQPAWANLPCKTLPAAQPSGGNPQLLVTKYESYSALDQPTRIVDSPGGASSPARTTTITYDAAGRQLKTKQAGGGTAIPPTETLYSAKSGMPEVQRFVCEAPQNCTGFDSQAVTTTYNTLGRVISYEDADGNVSQTGYDLLGRPVVATDGKGTQTMTYDGNSGALVGMTDSAAGTFTAAYDADGNIVAQGLPNGLLAQTTYDETGAPVHLRYDKVTGCSLNCTWLDFDVEESIHGQWLRQSSNLSAQEYAYDKAGRLTLVKDTPQGGGCTTRSYSFDANSNRTRLITRAPGTGGACDTRSTGTTKSYSYDTGDRLVGASITYDNWGRITNLPSAYSGGGTLTTSYYSNDLVQSQSQDGITNTYALDAAMRQRQRTQTGGSNPGTEVYHYAGGSDSPVWIDRGSSWSRNIVGFGALAVLDSANGITFQLSNLHGDIVATASSDPNATRLLSTFEFDEYGNPRGRTAGKYGWLGGKQRRTELPSGVIQMGVRSYVPAMGRFLSPDPIEGGSANDYEYAAGDPINNFDLTGTKCVGPKSWISRCKRQRELRTARRLARKTPNRASLIINCRKCGGASSSSIGDTFRSVVDKVSGAVDGAKTRFFRVGGSVYAKITAPSDAFTAAGDAFKLAQNWNPNRLIQAWQCGWYASGGSGTIGDCDPYEIVFGPPDKAR